MNCNPACNLPVPKFQNSKITNHAPSDFTHLGFQIQPQCSNPALKSIVAGPPFASDGLFPSVSCFPLDMEKKKDEVKGAELLLIDTTASDTCRGWHSLFGSGCEIVFTVRKVTSLMICIEMLITGKPNNKLNDGVDQVLRMKHDGPKRLRQRVRDLELQRETRVKETKSGSIVWDDVNEEEEHPFRYPHHLFFEPINHESLTDDETDLTTVVWDESDGEEGDNEGKDDEEAREDELKIYVIFDEFLKFNTIAYGSITVARGDNSVVGGDDEPSLESQLIPAVQQAQVSFNAPASSEKTVNQVHENFVSIERCKKSGSTDEKGEDQLSKFDLTVYSQQDSSNVEWNDSSQASCSHMDADEIFNLLLIASSQ
ncbi:hypothetical protein M8C21_005991 [Ambrosia artemisiifolia]|uniref:Uncharacterized protein n=1 Tax=Ambrosia artemisiifolia TaxID=4212 RepID=A0AAD5BQN8_AMBAR|nr:hypothetical protein M8C21_005991 [Ambrosia artemisiifolia]